MRFDPPLGAFASRYEAGEAQVVWTTLVADLETPVSAFLKVASGKPNTFLLESVEGGANRSRYSMIGLAPDVIWQCRDGVAEINRDALTSSQFEPCGEPAMDALRRLIAESRIDDMPRELPPMAAGVFGYLGYDMVRLMEKLPEPNPDRSGVADATLIRPTILLIFDAVRDEITVVTPVRPEPTLTARMALDRAVDRLTEVLEALDRPVPRSETAPATTLPVATPVSNTTPEEFRAMVDQAKEYIAAGDIFQVVLSQRFESEFDLPAFALYRALRRVNPAPFLVYLDFGGFQIVSSSPEILVRLRNGKVTIRPLAGTRRRGETEAEDMALGEELLADQKELAEHLMLLDLGRNDVGRVAQVGTVEVTDKFFLERFSHVMHIVSNVEGKISADHDALSALVAGFPAGTVSGAPKVRAMEIIDELEKDKRGVYAGCVGYFSANGDMDNCIALRTSVIKDGRMYVQAGAGIVADSVPESEHQECVNKAKALFRAAEEAVRFASTARRGQ